MYRLFLILILMLLGCAVQEEKPSERKRSYDISEFQDVEESEEAEEAEEAEESKPIDGNEETLIVVESGRFTNVGKDNVGTDVFYGYICKNLQGIQYLLKTGEDYKAGTRIQGIFTEPILDDWKTHGPTKRVSLIKLINIIEP